MLMFLDSLFAESLLSFDFFFPLFFFLNHFPYLFQILDNEEEWVTKKQSFKEKRKKKTIQPIM